MKLVLRLVRCLSLGLVGIVLPAVSDARGATIFYDDFADGSAVDGSPATWSGTPVWPYTTVAVEDGDLRIGTSRVDQSAVAGVRTLNLANSSIRAQTRLEGPGDLAAVFVRGVDSLGTAYALEVGDDGQLWLGLGGSWRSVASDLRPLVEDVVLQIDAIGRDVTAWAWRAGEPMPPTPVFRTRSFAQAFGYPGVYYGDVTRQGASGTAVFRYVRVADSPIPEPGTCGLFALASFGLLGRSARRRDPAAA